MKNIFSKMKFGFAMGILLANLFVTSVASAVVPLVMVFVTGAAMVGGVAVGFGLLSKTPIHGYDNVSWAYLDHLRLAIYNTETGQYTKTDDKEMLLPINAHVLENLEAYKAKLPADVQAIFEAEKAKAGYGAYYVALGKYVLENNKQWPNTSPRAVSAGDKVSGWSFEEHYQAYKGLDNSFKIAQVKRHYEATLAAYVKAEAENSAKVAEWRKANILTDTPDANTKP